MSTTNSVLSIRERTHGDYEFNANVAQNIKDSMRNSPGWGILQPAMRETLDLMATKIGRILAGDPYHLDHWVDLSGYPELIVELIKERGKR